MKRKTIFILMISLAVLSLCACGKGDVEKSWDIELYEGKEDILSEELVNIISINPLAGLIALVYSFISFLAVLIQLQCVFAFAHSFPSAKKKTSLIILSLFVVGTAISIIQSFPPVDIYLGVGSENIYSIMFYIGSEIDLLTFIPIMSIWSLIIRLAQIFGFYFLTIYLIDKKIEIQ